MTSGSDSRRRPWSIVVVGIVFIAAGVVGLVYHATELRAGVAQYEVWWVLVLRALAVMSGVAILRGLAWGPWLAVAWLAYHVVLSAFHSLEETMVHAVLLAVIGWVLFRRAPVPGGRLPS